jgi:acetyl esterase/lipase
LSHPACDVARKPTITYNWWAGARLRRSDPTATEYYEQRQELVMRITALLAVMLVASASQAAEPVVTRDVAYAEPKNERQSLDIYAPSAGKNHPVVLWIHGGGWRRGDKRLVQQEPPAFVDQGCVFVAMNYRFFPNVTLKQMTGDVAKAIHWIHDHIDSYGGDPSTVLVMGHSAGAHLAALVSTDDRYLKAEGLPLSLIKGCVPVDTAVYDAVAQVKSVAGPRAGIYRDAFGDEASQRELSPVTHVAKDKQIPPFLILHVADRADSSHQSKLLAKALTDAGVSAKTFAGEGKNHGTINSELGESDDPPTKAVFEFVKSVTKKQ